MPEADRHDFDPSALLPVVVGGDIGAYALLRAFHEEYGVRGVAISSVEPSPFIDTRIADVLVQRGIADETVLVQTLVELAQQHPGRIRLLMTNADWFVRTLSAHREQLEPHYRLVLPSPETFDAVSDKERFAALCEKLGIATPRTVAVHLPDLDDDAAVAALDVPLRYPLIGKPASSADYHAVDFVGKQKVHHFAGRAELEIVLLRLRAAGYAGTFLLQEFVPGGEPQLGSLTAYRDSHGEVTLLATGRVLLQEHTPDALGIPAAILTGDFTEAMEPAARFLDAADYFGFANFDFKQDPRTGELVFFEVNPRIGRNNYYVTAAGHNVARFPVEDLVAGRSVPQERATAHLVYSVVPRLLLLRYLPERALRSRVVRLMRQGRVAHPLANPADGSPQRRASVLAMTTNHVRKFLRTYPRPTDTGL
ncbi:carboxylate--amine ligase [Flexivirga sp. ID2601S]|uniref:Carboxylate--amine ligase n=1 Tax=Flexivirga aerilata TaxID=1656889 RepID=A0A849APG0_9MICO|nr:carboxylate--amine ligase [Flexivirga aerilata]NNG40200.1 carboxylate--amine ligase [Flexivirga aerilata]